MESKVVAIATVGMVALMCQWVSWWLKLPAILLLLIAGIVMGPATGWLNPDDLFGELLFPFISLSVAIILFEGSLTLKLQQIRGLERVVRNMVSTGTLVTWSVTTVATLWILEFPWELALLFGALTVVTGPTVIVPMLRTVRPNQKIAHILRWEGIVIDPIGALLAVLVYEFIVSGRSGAALGHTLWIFTEIIAIGVLLGVAGGYFVGQLLRKHWLPEYLHNMATLMLLFAVYALSNHIQEESGLLTVTVMGIWLANMKDVHVDQILDFKENLSILLISSLFIVLAARLQFVQLEQLGMASIWIFLILQFIGRPLKVLVSTWGSELSWQERSLLSWIAPRGIVAAAVSALFAVRLEQNGMEMAALLVPLTFLVIIGTVVLQSATARLIAGLLGVAEPEPNGVMIVGANPVARTVGNALQQHGIKVLLTDSSWENIRNARMDGLPTFFGSAVSEHADRHLDLVGIGHLLALSRYEERNALACMRYKREFDKQHVYHLQPKLEQSSDKHSVLPRESLLFGNEISYAKLASLISRNAEIKSTTITETFSYTDYEATYAKRAIPLFLLDVKKRLYMVRAGAMAAPGGFPVAPGWTVVSLVQSNNPEGKSKSNGGRNTKPNIP